MKRILIIEDDPAIILGLQDALTAEHYEVITAGDGETGLRAAQEQSVDLLILDLMLPGMNGEQICRELRSSGFTAPILILSSKNQELDKVLLLEMGADDYVTKPFGVRELIARIHALLRRSSTIREPQELIRFPHCVVDLKKHELQLPDGGKKELAAREVEILRYFSAHEGEVVSRSTLLDEVWGYDAYPTTRTVDNYILSLRKKIEPDPAHPQHILTVHTVGYKFVSTPKSERK